MENKFIDEFTSTEDWQKNYTILNERWNEVDNKMSTFYSKNIKINKKLYDNLQSVFDGIKFDYSEIDNYASASDVARLRIRIEDLKDTYGSLEGYIGYQLIEYSRKKKLKNKDLLLALLLIEYYKQYKEQGKAEEILFDEIKNLVYPQATVEVVQVMKKKVPKEIPELLDTAWLDILLALTYNGFSWATYRLGTIGYNANKLYELILIHLQQGKKVNVNDDDVKKLLSKQEKAYINKTKESDKAYESDYSGNIDFIISELVNKIILYAFKKQGCKKVQFIAVMDEKTTKMCKTLDGQIFEIDGINKYSRYSAEDNKNVTYTTKGLETGANLPPITNHFHYCRSTIYPVR